MVILSKYDSMHQLLHNFGENQVLHNRHYEKFADGTVKDIEDEILFEVPEGWAWCRLGSVYEVNPRVIGEDESLASFIPMEKIEANHANLFTYETDSWKIIKKNHTLFQDGDICFAKISPCFENGKAFIASNLVNGIGAGTTELIVLRNELIEKKYTFYFLGCDSFVKDCCYTFNGVVGQQRISSTFVKNHLFPLPPIEEQKRIVTEIEHLFTLINSLEKDKSDLQTAIKQAKSKILDLDIHGKLVPQDSSDEPASVLLEKLRAEKEAKIKAGALKRDKNDSYIYKNTTDNCYYQKFADGNETDITEEIPFEIPDKWNWCRIKDVCSVLMGQSPEGASVSNNPNGMEFHQGKIYFTDKYLSRAENYTSEVTRIAPENSLLLCVRAPVGVVNITKREICIGRGLCAIKPNYDIDEDFWFYWIQCQKEDFEQKATGTTFKAISVDTIKQQYIPLPPLAEQKRIVEKIENAFAKLDQIAEKLA